MKYLTKSFTPGSIAIFIIAGLSALSCNTGGGLRAAPAKSVADRTTVFDMDGRQIIQDEAYVGIINGKLTAGINYRDVAGVAGLWSPPFVSSNFMLDGRVNGEKVPTTKWTWRPYQVERQGSLGNVAVSSTTTMIYGQRAAVVSLTFKNSAAPWCRWSSSTSPGWIQSGTGTSPGPAAARKRRFKLTVGG